jgi:D-methionine transport system substrate-binding protein
VLPNIALNNGAIDANIFQDIPFLNAQIKARGFKLTPIAKTFVYPFGFYSRKIHSIAQLPYGAVVAIPEDPSNEGRALLLLQKAGLIKLAKGVGFTPTVLNIVSNPKHLQIKTLNAAQLPRVLTDAELVGLNNNYAKIAHFTVSQALIKEGPHAPYANIVVVRTQDKNNPVFKKLVAAMHSKQVINAVLKEFPNGAAIPAFKEKVN